MLRGGGTPPNDFWRVVVGVGWGRLGGDVGGLGWEGVGGSSSSSSSSSSNMDVHMSHSPAASI